MKQILLLALLTAPALSGCVSGVESDVAVASYPTYLLADRLAGDDLRVALVGKPGVSLHDYEPTLRDVDTLRRTDLLVLHGLGVEPWVEEALGSLGDRAPAHVEVAALPAGEAFLEADPDHGTQDGPDDHDHGVLDPHTWLDPLAYGAEADAIAAALSGRWPTHADAIGARLAALQQDIAALDQDYQDGLASCEHDIIVTNHNAYSYLARRYGFDVLALHGIEPGAQPDPDTVQEVIDTIKEYGLPVFFIEEGTDPGAVRAIREETGVEIRVLDTLGVAPRGGDRDYFAVQRGNLQHLQLALGCA